MSGWSDQKPSVQDARLSLRIRTTADLETLKRNAHAFRTLPRAGLVVSIPGLSAHQSRQLERSIRAYVRSCGCAEGAAAALIGAILVVGFIAFRIWMRGPQWSDVALVSLGLFVAVLAGGLGKLFGLAIAR